MTNEEIKAEQLVNQYRIILMNEDTECGNEILCTSIAEQCALICIEEQMKILQIFENKLRYKNYSENTK
jgi:hypothetical protein